MRIYLLTCLILIWAASCESDVDAPLNPIADTCPHKTELSFPAASQVKRLGEIDYYGQIQKFKYINDSTLFAVGADLNNLISLFTSTDNGRNWTGVEMTDVYHPIDMCFNKNLGLITLDSHNGELIMTFDHGQSWEVKKYNNLSGRISNLQVDKTGSIYAILERDGRGTLITSNDLAESWEYLSFAPNLDLNFFTYNFHNDHIYIAGENKTIVKYTLQGDIERIMNPPVGYIWDIEVINEDQIVVVGNEYTAKTIDGGLRWSLLYRGNSKLLAFENINEGLILLQKGLCQEDAFFSNDAIASTINGGNTWVSGNEVTNLSTSLQEASSIGNGSYVLLIQNAFYALKL